MNPSSDSPGRRPAPQDSGPSWPRRFWRRRRWFGKLMVVALIVAVPVGAFFGVVFAITYQDVRKDNTGTLRFANEVTIPPVLEPRVDDHGGKHFDLRMQTGESELLPGKRTETWGVNGAYLGPTIRANTGDHVTMHVTNDLPEASSLHWHGMRLPASMDGGPHQEVAPKQTWTPEWTVKQPAASLWYHPHPHGKTAKHVYQGVSGMFLIDDPESRSLGLPSDYGVDDIPLVIQDKKFLPDGNFDFSRAGGLGDAVGAGETGILGDTILVNGTHDPRLSVTSELTRLRVLNGSTARIYNIGFDDNRAFQVIASDSGLLPAPESRERILLSPGERAEIVVRLAPGETPVLRSFPGGLDAGFPAERFAGGDDTFDLIQLRAAEDLGGDAVVPSTLAQGEQLQAPPDARVRRFELGGVSINGQRMDMSRIDEVVPAGATEIWEIAGGGGPHNFHIHDVAFRILDIDGEPPVAWQAGRKDTVYLPPGKVVRVVVEFGTDVDPDIPYMYHCHLLYHEDSGMMGQFVIVPRDQVEGTSRTVNTGGEGHHGHG
ncbi:multicopper oxidase domain-containing protein [Saccharomonospora sp. NPDC006951]